MLERIEWTRYWREDADLSSKKVLLIGDSIVNGCTKEIQKNLPDGYAVTAVVSSKGLNNPYFIKEIALFCEQENYQFEAIYFNNGLHFQGQSPAEYKENYIKMLGQLKELMPSVPMVLGLSTPLTCGDGGDPQKHETPVTLKETNATVLAFNEKVMEIAKEQNLPTFDAYELMLPHPEMKSGDGCHFNSEGIAYLGKAMAEAIINLL